MKTILFTKESWLCSQLSVAKYSGGVQIEDEDGKKVEMAMWDEIKNDLKEEK